MPLTPIQTLVMILAIALGTMATRFTPFLLFPDRRDPPRIVAYLGQVLPPAMLGLLVVYSLKGVSLTAAPHGIPEALSLAAVAALHRWKGNVLLSVGGGTVLYMLLVQRVFA